MLDGASQIMKDIEYLERIFLQITSMTSSHVDLDTILQYVVKESLNCLNGHRASIFSLDKNIQNLKVPFTHASDPSYKQVSLLEEKEVARKAMNLGRSYLLREQKDFLGFFENLNQEGKITSLIIFPFSSYKKENNALSLVRMDEEYVFNERDLRILSIFGNHASIAIENAFLLTEVRRGGEWRKTYQQSLGDLENKLENLIDKDGLCVIGNIQRFLTEKKIDEQTKSEFKSHYLDPHSETYKIPMISLRGFSLSSTLQKVVGEKYAEKHEIVVLENSAERIRLALGDPTASIMNELRKILPRKKKIDFYLANPDEVLACFRKHCDPFSINYFK